MPRCAVSLTVSITSTTFLQVGSIAVKSLSSLKWLLDHGANPNMMSQRLLPGSCLQPTTPLAEAATLSDPGALRLLLSHGAEMDPEAIFHAIGIRYLRNGTATLKELLEHGADANYDSDRWCTPLHYAVRRGLTDKLKVLLQYGADPNVKPLNEHASALEYAMEEGQTEMYEIMKAAQSKDEA
jgi:ankyrin repeat protein